MLFFEAFSSLRLEPLSLGSRIEHAKAGVCYFWLVIERSLLGCFVGFRVLVVLVFRFRLLLRRIRGLGVLVLLVHLRRFRIFS